MHHAEVGHLGDEVEPEQVEDEKDAEESAEHVVCREVLDDLAGLDRDGVDDPGGEVAQAGHRPRGGEAVEQNLGDLAKWNDDDEKAFASLLNQVFY